MSAAPSVSYSITVRLDVPTGGRTVSQLSAGVESTGGRLAARVNRPPLKLRVELAGIRHGEDEFLVTMTTQDILQRNKQNVQAFYDLMFNQSRPAGAIATYAGETYRQHNPHVGDGKQAFIDYFERRGSACGTTWPAESPSVLTLRSPRLQLAVHMLCSPSQRTEHRRLREDLGKVSHRPSTTCCAGSLPRVWCGVSSRWAERRTTRRGLGQAPPRRVWSCGAIADVDCAVGTTPA
jgi:hypothetical protein